MEHLGILWLQAALDDVQVVGVYFRLVRTYGVRPSAQVTDNVLHVEVAALHDTHLDGRTTFGYTFVGELQQLSLEIPGVRQISLYHNAGLVVLELWQ